MSEAQQVSVLNVAAVSSEVCGDAVGPGLLADHRRCDDAWFGSATRLTHGGDMIYVDVESRSHKQKLDIRCQMLDSTLNVNLRAL